ncbi:MAG: hypothetical protein JWR80_3881 [Bradyrhizobium sp.]|nr:hypothetical protein [Bradyrhizobium sp.]
MNSRLLIVARAAAPFVLTALLLWLVSHAVDSGEVWRQLSAIKPGFFAAAVVLMVVNTAFATLRYQAVLRALCPGNSVRFAPLMKLNLFSAFSAHFLPFGALADLMRVFVSRRLLDMPVGMAAEGVIADRLLAVAGFALFGLLLLPIQIGSHWPWPSVAAQAALFGGVFAVLTVACLGLSWRSKFLGSVSAAARRFVGHVATRRGFSWQVWLAACSSASFAGMLALLALSLGLHLSVWTALAAAPAICLSQVIPIFYAGFGSREVALVALLVPSGLLGNSEAVALGLCVGLCNLAASLPGAIFAWPLLRALGSENTLPQTLNSAPASTMTSVATDGS